MTNPHLLHATLISLKQISVSVPHCGHVPDGGSGSAKVRGTRAAMQHQVATCRLYSWSSASAYWAVFLVGT